MEKTIREKRDNNINALNNTLGVMRDFSDLVGPVNPI